MKKGSKKEAIKDIMRRGTTHVVVEDSLRKKLESGKVLRIKHGVDPTTPDLHLGYYVVYRKLRALQDLGHTIVFLIGDFTARFGDPTGRMDVRAGKTGKETRALAKNYIKQVSTVLDMEKTEVRYNSEWYEGMKADEFMRMLEKFSVWRILERDLFQERKKERKELRISEFIYPLLQAYDSVMIEADVTVIGSDQVFNETQARHMQEYYGQAPQDIVAVDLLVGLDGVQKMSQSLGNYVGLRELSRDQFGKLMSIPDDLMPHYYELLTDTPLKTIDALKKAIAQGDTHPRDIKLDLAETIVASLHGEKSAADARAEFIRVFRKGEEPDDIEEHAIASGSPLREVMRNIGAVDSLAAADRLIRQGAVSLGGEKIVAREHVFRSDAPVTLKVGKHRFYRLVPSERKK